MPKCNLFIGNSRSGTHALQAWILDQWGIESFDDHRLKVYGLFKQNHPSKRKIRIIRNKRNLLTQINQNTQNTLLTFESRPLREVEACIKWLSQHDIEYGFVFILLRDPFNWLASFLRYIEIFRSTSNISKNQHFQAPTQIKYWKTYALQFSKPRIERTLGVSYNSWFSSKEYRKILSKKIGGHFSESTVNIQGRSRSSFPDENASQRRVLDRWKEMHDKQFQRLINDPELLSFCKDIFGETEAYKHFNV